MAPYKVLRASQSRKRQKKQKIFSKEHVWRVWIGDTCHLMVFSDDTCAVPEPKFLNSHGRGRLKDGTRYREKISLITVQSHLSLQGSHLLHDT